MVQSKEDALEFSAEKARVTKAYETYKQNFIEEEIVKTGQPPDKETIDFVMWGWLEKNNASAKWFSYKRQDPKPINGFYVLKNLGPHVEDAVYKQQKDQQMQHAILEVLKQSIEANKQSKEEQQELIKGLVAALQSTSKSSSEESKPSVAPKQSK